MSKEEKRQFYGDRLPLVRTLEDIPPWGDSGESLHAMEGPPKLPLKRQGTGDESFRPQYDPEVNSRVSLMKHGVFNLEIDAIVNPANSALKGGTGSGSGHAAWVNLVVSHVAGYGLAEERASLGSCREGEAKVTYGYLLPAENVIHTVHAQNGDLEVLASCYRSCLEMVKLHGFRTVAFPCIANGSLDFTVEESVRVHLRTVREWMEQGKGDYLTDVDRIIFCVSGWDEMDFYRQLFPFYFPIKPETPEGGDATGQGSQSEGGKSD